MTNWIITSSVLILIVVLLRTVLKGRISLRLQYALWGLVLLRLLVPGSLFESNISVMNAVPPSVTEAVRTENVYHAPVQNMPVQAAPVQPQTAPAAQLNASAAPTTQPVSAPQAASGSPVETAPSRKVTLSDVLTALWIAGICAVAGALTAANVLFSKRLRWARKPFATDLSPIPVYVVNGIPSPCLFGLFRPAIYLTPEVTENETQLRHILTHELTHLRHGDNWWSLLRSVALALHWYNPLVWLAAVLSRRDGEMACDEGAIRVLGEDQRLDYGRTLISLVSRKQNPGSLLCYATTMNSGKRSLTERIRLLAKKPRMLAVTLVAVILLSIAAVGCTFTGRNTEEEPQDTEPVETQPIETEPTETLSKDNSLGYYTAADYGVILNIPEEYLPRLRIGTAFMTEYGGTCLGSFRERASVDAHIADYGDDEWGDFYADYPDRTENSGTLGLLFEVCRLTSETMQKIALGQYGDDCTFTVFARDSEYYYATSIPNNVKPYRSGGDLTDEDWAAWNEMLGLVSIVQQNMIADNDLVPYDPEALQTFQLSGGWEFSIPDVLCNRVICTDMSQEKSNTDDRTLLFMLQEKASVDAFEADGQTPSPGNYIGLLLEIERVSSEVARQLVEYESPGYTIFARDPEYYYYVMHTPTDLPVYRSGVPAAEGYPEWFELQTELKGIVPATLSGEKRLLSLNPSAPLKTVADFGLEVPLPSEYQDLVILEENGGWDDTYGTCLYALREIKSVEDYIADYGTDDGYAGRLFTIHILSQAEFEQFMSSGWNLYFFAKDEAQSRYFAFGIGGGVNQYRSVGGGTTAADTSEWAALWEAQDKLAENIIRANGLTSYTDEEFEALRTQDFYFEGEHAYAVYYPNYAEGDLSDYYFVTLTQPAKQGEGGIWCVDRVDSIYSGQVHRYRYFPAYGIPAAEWYQQLQAYCDAGLQTEFLTPLGAAEAALRDRFSVGSTAGSIFLTDASGNILYD